MAADQGNPDALYKLGKMSNKTLSQRSRNQQKKEIQTHCAILHFFYEKGTGLEKDNAKAIEYYKNAAELGNTFAQIRIKDLV